MDEGLIRRLAVLCKDYYSLQTIDDLFAFAGTSSQWHIEVQEPKYGQRMTRFYEWVEGIKYHAPEKIDPILRKVAEDVIRNDAIPVLTREAIRKELENFQQHQTDRIELEPLLATLARSLANDGLSRELAILVAAEPRMEWEETDRLNGNIYALYLSVPFKLYAQIEPEIKVCETLIFERIWPLLRSIPNEHINRVVIASKMMSDNNWRDKAIAWLTGESVNNQGRVRSDNVAPRTIDGLQFRSEQEINLYKALKAKGVSFAPLPVFVRGGKTYQRIEPDFVILKDGIALVVEVDGDTFHRETPAEAYNRTTMLEEEGVRIVRVTAKECETPEKAANYASRILQIIAKIKDTNR